MFVVVVVVAVVVAAAAGGDTAADTLRALADFVWSHWSGFTAAVDADRLTPNRAAAVGGTCCALVACRVGAAAVVIRADAATVAGAATAFVRKATLALFGTVAVGDITPGAIAFG